METLFMLLFALILFYFILVLPVQLHDRRRRKELASLVPGDEIETESGLIGTVMHMSPREVRLQLGEGVEVRVTPQSVRGRRKAPPMKKEPVLSQESSGPQDNDREGNQ